MKFIQETKLVRYGNGRYTEGNVVLYIEVRDYEGRLLRYEYLDSTPIYPSSEHYETYVRLKASEASIINFIN